MPHTLRFTSVEQATTNFSPTAGASEDKDISRAGKVIGYDVLSFCLSPKTNTTSIGAAVDLNLNGGFLYGVMRESEGPVTRGTVTGGTGTYRGATGTITAKTLDKDGTKTPSPSPTARSQQQHGGTNARRHRASRPLDRSPPRALPVTH